MSVCTFQHEFSFLNLYQQWLQSHSSARVEVKTNCEIIIITFFEATLKLYRSMFYLDREDMNDNINSTGRHSHAFSDAIVNEDLGLLATYCKRHGCNFVIAVRQNNVRLSSIKEVITGFDFQCFVSTVVISSN